MTTKHYRDIDNNIKKIMDFYEVTEYSELFLILQDYKKVCMDLYNKYSNVYKMKHLIIGIIYFLKNYYVDKELQQCYLKQLSIVNKLIRTNEKGKRIKKLNTSINNGLELDKLLNVIIRIDNKS